MDAVGVGMGTVRADDPALTARGVGAATQPRRLAFGRGPLQEESKLELLSGPWTRNFARSRRGRALAAARGRSDAGPPFSRPAWWTSSGVLAPTLSGEGAGPVEALREPRPLHHLSPSGRDDVLLTAYVHEP